MGAIQEYENVILGVRAILRICARSAGGYPHPGWFWAKSAEVIDKQRVEKLPLQKRVRNPLKRKDLNVWKAGMERAKVGKIEIGVWQTRETIA
jgi:hypothetical protein